MTQRATRRPPGFIKPAYWSDAPAPRPRAAHTAESDPSDPTRYGDWVKNGIAIDF